MKLDIKSGELEFPKAERRKVHDVAALVAAAAKHDARFAPHAESMQKLAALVGPVEEK